MELRPGALRRTAVIVLAAVAVNVAIAAARGWAPDPWWQAPVFIVVVTILLAPVWKPTGRADSAR
jgi:hypothetical protein